MSRFLLAVCLWILAAPAFGCGNDGPGPASDSGGPAIDSGAPLDTGSPTTDTGASPDSAALDVESCLPEFIPAGGFVDSEVSLETASAQCASRVCMVYELGGVPFGATGCATAEEAAANPECATEAETAARVYCTCRCDAPPESMASLCTCTAGNTCVNAIDQPGAGLGIRGSYCVRDGTY